MSFFGLVYHWSFSMKVSDIYDNMTRCEIFQSSSNTSLWGAAVETFTAYLISCFFNHRATTSVTPGTNNTTVWRWISQWKEDTLCLPITLCGIWSGRKSLLNTNKHTHTRTHPIVLPPHSHKIAPSHPLNKFNRLPPFYLFSSVFILDLPLNHPSLRLCCLPPNSWSSCKALSLVLKSESLFYFFLFSEAHQGCSCMSFHSEYEWILCCVILWFPSLTPDGISPGTALKESTIPAVSAASLSPPPLLQWLSMGRSGHPLPPSPPVMLLLPTLCRFMPVHIRRRDWHLNQA